MRWGDVTLVDRVSIPSVSSLRLVKFDSVAGSIPPVVLFLLPIFLGRRG